MKDKSKANRGISFEKEIELACDCYEKQKKAIIKKIPTAWKVIRGYDGKIKNAFPESKSICDFLGLRADGKAIAFEAKETNNKTSFPLSRIEPHQWKFLETWYACRGEVFVLIHFSTHKEVYKIPMEKLLEYRDRMNDGGRKSIAYDEIKDFKIDKQQGYLEFL